jgi:hypothetical protein
MSVVCKMKACSFGQIQSRTDSRWVCHGAECKVRKVFQQKPSTWFFRCKHFQPETGAGGGLLLLHTGEGSGILHQESVSPQRENGRPDTATLAKRSILAIAVEGVNFHQAGSGLVILEPVCFDTSEGRSIFNSIKGMHMCVGLIKTGMKVGLLRYKDQNGP